MSWGDQKLYLMICIYQTGKKKANRKSLSTFIKNKKKFKHIHKPFTIYKINRPERTNTRKREEHKKNLKIANRARAAARIEGRVICVHQYRYISAPPALFYGRSAPQQRGPRPFCPSAYRQVRWVLIKHLWRGQRTPLTTFPIWKLSKIVVGIFAPMPLRLTISIIRISRRICNLGVVDFSDAKVFFQRRASRFSILEFVLSVYLFISIIL